MRDFLREPIVESITIAAPLARVFELSTNVDLVQRTLDMKLVSGPAVGHIAANSRVHWRGWKFGLPTDHHTLITAFEPPCDGRAFFQDSQEQGRFASFHHDHFFRESLDGATTTLEDRIYFALPFGVLGRLVAGFVLAPHIRRLARERFAAIQELAEAAQG